MVVGEHQKIKTLDEALKVADPYTTIKLCEGVYFCLETITKPGIIIEKRDKTQ